MGFLQRTVTEGQARLSRLGAMRSARVIGTLLVAFCAWILLDNHLLHVSTGLAEPTYDLMVRSRLRAAPPDPRIVVVDIDEASLERMGREFGRWPWPRDTLATVLDHIESQQPAAIVWDILFSDPDRLSPGGDSAFDAAAARSRHSHFSVVRPPESADRNSEIRRPALPGLWAQAGTAGDSATVALIPPFLASVAGAPLGLTNAYPDPDGVIRRHQPVQRLADGGVLQSMGLAVLKSLQPQVWEDRVRAAAASPRRELVAWRKVSQEYPHVPFADVFDLAEGQTPQAQVPSFRGRIVLIGATATALHDFHPTAVSARQGGVDTLATLIDNELNQRILDELPAWAQSALAVLMCVGITLLVRYRSLSVLDGALIAMPAVLLGISFASLHTERVFLDLHLATGSVVIFLTVVRLWAGLRRRHWCGAPVLDGRPIALQPILAEPAWTEAGHNRLMTLLERHAPDCRLLLPGGGTSRADWAEFRRFAALVGPPDQLRAAAPALQQGITGLGGTMGVCQILPDIADRTALVAAALAAWLPAVRSSPTTHQEASS